MLEQTESNTVALEQLEKMSDLKSFNAGPWVATML